MMHSAGLPPHENWDRDHRDHEHQHRGELSLAKASEHSRVGPQVAEEEAAEPVQPEVGQAKRTIWQPGFEALVNRQQRSEQHQCEDHLVRHLGVDHQARLTKGVGVDVLHAPREVGRRAVMLAIDHVSDAADRKADHGRRPGCVDDLPVRDRGAPRPDVSAEHRAEQAAPLADASLG